MTGQLGAIPVKPINSLTIDGICIPLSAECSLRFVDIPDQPAKPVLYVRGRRVIKAWTLTLSHEEPADPWGCSG